MVDPDYIAELERRALRMPKTEIKWAERGYHVWCEDALDRKIGGPIFNFEYRRWVLATCPAELLPFLRHYRELLEENQELKLNLEKRAA